MRLFSSLLALVLAIGPAGAQSYGPAGNSSVVIPNFTANGGLPKWQLCRQKVITNSPIHNCKMLIIGDSTTAGQGANYNTTNSDARAFSTPSELASLLTTIYNLNSSAASVVGVSGLGTAGAYAAYDTRVKFNTNWGLGTCAGCLSSFSYSPGDTTTALQFNPADSAASFPSNIHQTDTLEIVGLGYTGSGNINVNVNGGSTVGTVTLNCCGAIGTFTTGSVATALGNNNWGMIATSAHNAFPMAWRAYNSAVSEVSIMNAGWAGSSVANWVSQTANPFDPLSEIETINPDLCVLDLTINDATLGAITSGTYNSGTGIITLTMAVSQYVFTGNVTLSGLTGTGTNLAALNGTWASTSVSGTTITLQGPTGQGAISITGGIEVPAFYGISLGSIITACKAGSGDVLMVTGNPSNPTTISYATQAAYVAAFKAAATTNNVAVLDMWSNLCGTYAGGTCSQGWLAGMGTGSNGAFNTTADPLHMGVAGYWNYVFLTAQVLML